MRFLPAALCAGAVLTLSAPAFAQECTAVSNEPTLESLARSVRDARYAALPAADKQDALYAAVEATRYTVKPPLKYGTLALGWNLIKGFGSLSQFFDSTGDALSPRDKIFHPFGTVAKVEFVPVAGSPYTGMLKERSVGILRLSLGGDDTAWVSGAAIKFLVDGHESVNMVGIPNAEPQKTRDFFENAPTNDLPKPSNTVAGWGIRAVNLALGLVANPSKRPLDNLAKVTPDGRTVAVPKYPEQVFLRPMLHQDPASTADPRDLLGAIPSGTTVYEMWAKNADGTDTKIGDLKTTSPFVASGFGDHVLYFRHNC